MVAGILHKLGVTMVDAMAPADRWNAAGNYQDLEFSRLLMLAMPNWKSPREWSLAPYREEMQAYLRGKQAAHKHWGLKHPRMCYMLDEIVAMIGKPVKLIVTSRDIHASIRSIMRCFDSLDCETAERLERDCDTALREQKAFRTLPKLQVRYEDVVSCASPRIFVRRIAEFVGCGCEYSREAVAAIRPELNHEGRAR
jgi:hypothetical protein